MTKNATINATSGSLVVSGELDFDTVVILWRDSLALLAKHAHLNFDFKMITASNSAGIALLLEWVKYAKEHNKTISFENIPSQLMSIISVSGLQNILNV